jgi:hypothetical protein
MQRIRAFQVKQLNDRCCSRAPPAKSPLNITSMVVLIDYFLFILRSWAMLKIRSVNELQNKAHKVDKECITRPVGVLIRGNQRAAAA